MPYYKVWIQLQACFSEELETKPHYKGPEFTIIDQCDYGTYGSLAEAQLQVQELFENRLSSTNNTGPRAPKKKE